MEEVPASSSSRARSFMQNTATQEQQQQQQQQGIGSLARAACLRYFNNSFPQTTSSFPGGGMTRKHFLDEPPFSSSSSSVKSHAKKMKLDHNTIVTSLPHPVQEAIVRFRVTSEVELDRLRKEGYDASASVSKLVKKMRSESPTTTVSDSDDDVNDYSREDIDLVMELSGFNEEGAMRALILRDELAKLRVNGFEHPEAVDELSLRMKRMVGEKRRPSLSLSLSPPTARKLPKRTKRASPSSSSSSSSTATTAATPQTTTTTSTTTTSTSISTDDVLAATLPPRFAFEDLVLMSPSRKRVYDDVEEDEAEAEYEVKRQRLLEALEYAHVPEDMGDDDIYFGEDLPLGFAGGAAESDDELEEEEEEEEEENEHIAEGGGLDVNGFEFGVPVPISFAEEEEEEDDHTRFNENISNEDIEEEEEHGDDPFISSSASESVSYNDEEHDGSEEQVWRYNPLVNTHTNTKKHTSRREQSGGNRSVL